MKHLDVLEIHWLDSEAHIGWQEAPAHSEHRVISIGILAHESSQTLTLGLSYDEHTDEWNPLITIPKVAIKKRKRLCKISTTKK